MKTEKADTYTQLERAHRWLERRLNRLSDEVKKCRITRQEIMTLQEKLMPREAAAPKEEETLNDLLSQLKKLNIKQERMREVLNVYSERYFDLKLEIYRLTERITKINQAK